MPPVLLLHGIDDTGRKMEALDRHLGERGWPHRVRFDMVPPDGQESLSVLSRQVAGQAAALLERTGAKRIDLVAFSMGTIIGRHYLQRRGGSAQVRRFVSISGPHHGTLTGFLRGNPGASELRPGSAFLADLNGDPSGLAPVRCTSIWTPFDLMILPAASSRVPWARNVTVPVLLHPWMVEDVRVLHAVEAALTED